MKEYQESNKWKNQESKATALDREKRFEKYERELDATYMIKLICGRITLSLQREWKNDSVMCVFIILACEHPNHAH